MLRTKESWENKSRGRWDDEVFGEPGVRYYAFVEIPLDLPLFHVDVMCREEDPDEQLWIRLVTDEIGYVLAILDRDDIVELRISLQSKRRDGTDEYGISPIMEIVVGRDRCGHTAHIYKFANDESYLDSSLVTSESELLEQRIVWSRNV